ncbi:hypothetical protein [Streptomyces mutabilis]|uniref:Uncharacterized protein n=1 Tax=Streptomyces mutabilis TaxID=67332 RepID=A0A086MRJ1_9ACTN|nr:hypothetical protein [Streptomyces mutabilis]KFG71509.1 hypothetical protein FM21_35245 [Streptomyces mutabilis]
MSATPPPESLPNDQAEAQEQCSDLVQGYDEDGPTAFECGAPLRHTDSGYSCARGHSYTYAAVRAAEGWDYASDAVEAALLGHAGVIGIRPDDGRPWL